MADESDPKLEMLLEYVKESRGFDFTGYKRPSLIRRIGRRMDELKIDGYDRYLDHLQADPDEFTALFNTILINLTSFFRDPPVWELIAQNLLPRMLSVKAEQAPIRIWCAGCATGEEAYSIAMLLASDLGVDAFRERVKVFATDVDEEALAIARHGWYPAKALQAIPERYVEAYFVRENDGAAFAPDLRRSLIFGRHDLVQDAPISRTDFVICRNTIMYMNAETQQRVIDNIAFGLNEGGFLILGKSEMLFSKLRSFASMDLKRRVFMKVENEDDRRFEANALGRDADKGPADHGERLAFDLGPVAELLIDPDGTLVQVNRRGRDLLGLRRHDVGKEFYRFEASFRPVELRTPIDQAKRSGRAMLIRGVASTTPEGRDVIFDIQIVPLIQGEDHVGTVITFTDVTEFHELRANVERSNQELETAMEELQSTNEELETTNEELQSSNEELETTNEELQSSNEELETTNEELQSTNEELETMNEELQERTTELAELNGFMDAVMSTLDAAVAVLDDDLRIRHWNREAEDLWGLREDEARGRSLNELDIGLPTDPVRDLVRSALRGDGHGDVVVDARDRRGRSIRCEVMCSVLKDGMGDDHERVLLVVRPEAPDEG